MGKCQQWPGVTQQCLIMRVAWNCCVKLLYEFVWVKSVRSLCWHVWQGYKEVTLLGQNVNSYRDTSSLNFTAVKSSSSSSSELSAGFETVYRSRSGGLRFADLLSRVADVNPHMRIRFTSPHPKDFPDDVNTPLHSLYLSLSVYVLINNPCTLSLHVCLQYQPCLRHLGQATEDSSVVCSL